MGAVSGMRKSYLRPTPSLTPDRDEAKCHVRPEWFDELVQPKADPEVVEAIKHTCDACPLQVGCWAENAGEMWLRRLQGKHSPKRLAVSSSWAKRRADRLAIIEDTVAAGGSVEDVAAEIGILPLSIYTWCIARGHRDLFYRLEGAEAVIAAKRERLRAKRQEAAA